MTTYTFMGYYIPDRMMPALRRWIEHKSESGDFLHAVLCNDLRGAVGHGDDENVANLPAFVGYLYNEAPAPCWGSADRVAAWAALALTATEATL